MSIYDESLFATIQQKMPYLKKLLLLVIALIILTWLFLFLSDIFEEKAIHAEFSPSGLAIDSSSPSSVLLTVSIKNITEDDASNVSATIETVDKSNLLVGTKTEQLASFPAIEKCGERILKRKGRENPSGNIVSGNYIIRIQTEINGKQFSHDAVLKVTVK